MKNAVFIWIPKTGGTSLHKMLGEPPILMSLPAIEREFRQCGMVTFGHVDYKRLLDDDYVWPDFDEEATKFTIVRNPFDRAVSLYVYLREIHRRQSFLDFCRSIEKGVDPIGLYNRRTLSQCNPQVRWIENVDIDYRIRFENFEADSVWLFTQLGMKWPGLSHLNSSDHKPWQEYYCRESAEIVREVYREDFEKLGYSMQLKVGNGD